MSLDLEHSIFPHQCSQQGCDRTVQYDDEPWCFTHSPDEGSHVTGWSSRRLAIEAAWRTYWDADRRPEDGRLRRPHRRRWQHHPRPLPQPGDRSAGRAREVGSMEMTGRRTA